jgi:hypothetical protein
MAALERHRFLVGVIGHRPPRLVHADIPALCARLREVLTLVSEHASQHAIADGSDEPAEVELVAVSPLAEGADQLFAEQALNLGYLLICPMAFSQAENALDFVAPRACSPDAHSRYLGLLDRARASGRLEVIEFPGDRSQEADAYAAVGRFVVECSHLIVAVWDGDPILARGGTYDTLQYAASLGRPTIVVGAKAPHEITLTPHAYQNDDSRPSM